MPKVFNLQDPVPNAKGWTPSLESAAEFGSIHHVFDKTDQVYRDPLAAKKKALAKMKTFNPEEDFLLWANAGDPLIIAIVVGVMAKNGIKEVTFLSWKKGQYGGYYLPVRLSFDI